MESGIMTIGIVAVVLVITLASFIPMIFIFGKFFKRQAANAKLMQSGVSAQAQILSIQETGTRINDQPELLLVLSVASPGQAPYQTQAITVVSFLMIPKLQPGMMVPVKIDPANPMSVAIDQAALGAVPMGMGAVQPGMPYGMQPAVQPAMPYGVQPGMPYGAQPGMYPQQAMAMAQQAAMQAPAGGSIITCPQCRNPYAIANPRCPNCGAPKPG